jgi:chromosome segregation ATPase
VKKRTVGLAASVFFIIAIGGYTYLNRQYIKDYYIVSTTDLSTESTELASRISLTNKGDFLYQASQSELQKSSAFKQSCSGIEKQAIVLGCYTRQRIYIYDVTDKRLEGVREVTAAHELLHGAYERLSSSQRSKLDDLLVKQAKLNTDKNITKTLALYKGLGRVDLLNEMHSIFGTEASSLQPELEKYYKNYFKDRSKIVAYAKEYQDVFRSLQEQVDSLKDTLKGLNVTKEQYEANLNSLKEQLKSQQNSLNRLRNQSVSEYNAAVDEFNSKVNYYNSLVATYKQLINQMNGIISQINANVTEQNDLTKKLDSNYGSF